MPWQSRVYDFPGEEQEVLDAAMRLQLVLRPDMRLQMIRARRLFPCFIESDE